ncbi:conserved hypothetical protein [Trichinella spiralis]|uniref:Uncharacterized protein n=1 Tax=Trichinella spiralis TaxID=6334 RepID=E5S4I8_TRISP|nr:conserved hypothetical protein [Trichinella spiralis]KRY29277.1 hypothetical protein T01_9215 [Trichinella spiralis]
METPPRYELLGPARKAKLNVEQNAAEKRMLLTVTCAMLGLTILVITVGIAVFLLLESGWNGKALKKFSLIAKSAKIDSVVDLNEVCNELSTDSYCAFSPKMHVSSCKEFLCESYSWKLNSFAHKMGISYIKRSISIRPPDGTPCGPRSWCFEEQCVPSYDREIMYKLHENREGSWVEDRPDNSGCFQFGNQFSVKNLLSEPSEGKCTSERYQLKLRLFKCDYAKGVSQPCSQRHLHNYFSWKNPLLFNFPARSTCIIPTTKDAALEICKNKRRVGNVKVRGCTYRCSDEDAFTVFTNPVECEIASNRKGHCFLGMCIPRVIVY